MRMNDVHALVRGIRTTVLDRVKGRGVKDYAVMPMLVTHTVLDLHIVAYIEGDPGPCAEGQGAIVYDAVVRILDVHPCLVVVVDEVVPEQVVVAVVRSYPIGIGGAVALLHPCVVGIDHYSGPPVRPEWS